jgi:hypothetical protein
MQRLALGAGLFCGFGRARLASLRWSCWSYGIDDIAAQTGFFRSRMT